MDIKITLIIPVYNVEKYLVQCLESVVNQTKPFDEVILINDGSTDNSTEICKKYAARYDYFQLINQENLGQSVARNIGLKRASGDYVMFLDSDDWLNLNTIEHIKEYLKKSQPEGIYFDACIFYDDFQDVLFRDVEDRSCIKMSNELINGWDFFDACYPRYYMAVVWGAIYKRSVISNNQIEFPEGLNYEDNYFAFVFLSKAKQVMHISKQWYHRRYHINSIMTSAYSERKFNDYIRCILLIWEYIQHMDSSDLHVQKEVLLQFVSDHYDIIHNNYKYCEEKEIILSKKSISLLREVTKQYFKLLKLLNFDSLTSNLANLVMIMKNFFRIEQCNLKQNIVMETMLYNIVSEQKKYYIEILEKLPFDKQRLKVGIYGTGNHTEGLLAIYERVVGDIKCDLVFIDSYKDNGVYMNAPLVNYKKINQSYDCIIISSFLYEQEMLQNIKSLNMDIPVYRFYKDISTDIFSNYRILLRYI